VGLWAQIKAFLLTFILGVLAGLIFHYYQTTIRNLRVGRIVLYLMDFMLWLILIIVIAAALLLINQGEMRVYVFLALLAGAGVYYASLAKRLQPPVLIMGRSTARFLRTLQNWVVKPPIKMINWLKQQYRQRKTPPPDDEPEEIEK
jgi:spore cortex biosynthesis protein YabQ